MRYILPLLLLLFYAYGAHAEGVAPDSLASASVPAEAAEAAIIDADEPAEAAEVAVIDASVPTEAAETAVIDASEPTEAAEVAIIDADAAPACCTPASRYAFRPQQLAFPAVALALGGAGVNNHLVNTSSERERWTTIDDQLQYVPIVAYAGLGFIPGVKHEHHIGDRFLAGATAYVCMTAVCQGLKHAIGEPRPDSDKANSFPSGHTATAFCGAELCRLEYGNAYGAAAYAFAATTGVMRVVNNRHWCNDVLAGAGIGFLSAHIGYWLLPWEKRVARRIFHRDTPSTAFLLAPTYEYATKAPSFTFAMTF